MKNIKSKKNIFIIVFLLVISSTIAFLYSTDTFQNIFVAASYKVVVTEEFVSPDNWVPGDTTPKTVTLKNEGTVPIKVRVKLEEEWKDSNNQDLPLEYNGENVSIINFANEEDYILKDGYYYYDPILNPGETTSSILKSVTFNPNYSGTVTCVYTDDYTEVCSSSDDGYEGGTYKLKITLEGVQEEYYIQAWGLSGEVFRQTLYNVLKRETESNGLAREYTGEHQDSMDVSKSTEKIYHWYASNNTEGTQILDKNNVVFGNQCWQMIRTTDTGGVKMIYNGEVEDDQCLNTRGNHIGYNDNSIYTSLNSNYWYGSDFVYDDNAKTFKVSGTTEQVRWNNSNYNNLIGKFTCKSSDIDTSCSSLYLITSYKSATEAYVLGLDFNSHYSQFGKSKYNNFSDSLAYVGYKYGDVYENDSLEMPIQVNLSFNEDVVSSFTSPNTSYLYADSISYNSSTRKYSLVNPTQVTESELVGKYTFLNTNGSYSSSKVYYITGVIGSSMYFKVLNNGELVSDFEPIIMGDSITENFDGTYTINNSFSISLIDWNANYRNYKKMYTCHSNSNTCAEPRYIYYTNTVVGYYYVKANEKIAIAKSRNGLNLIDGMVVYKDEWAKNYKNYGEYKYTCGNESLTCTDATLRLITSIGEVVYQYIPNYGWGASVTWDGTNYTLVDTLEIEDYKNKSSISNHHYVCLNPYGKTCSSIGYVFYYNTTSQVIYVEINNGVSSISKAMEDMLTKNTNDSLVKVAIEAWYNHFMLEYDSYIDDTIFCGDRSINSLEGFNPNGGNLSSSISMGNIANIKCTNETDKFSVSNPLALLKYKVGLVDASEILLLNNANARKTGESYWTSFARNIHSVGSAAVRIISHTGFEGNNWVSTTTGVRPVISLKQGVEYSSGDGSMANPYIVKMD